MSFTVPLSHVNILQTNARRDREAQSVGSTTYNVYLKTSGMFSYGNDKAAGCAAYLEDRQNLFSERTKFFRFVTRFVLPS